MRSIYSNIIHALIKLSGQHVIIPFYHAVTDKTLDFTKQLYPPRSIDNFKRDLEVLTRFYKPVSLQDLISIVKSGKKNKQNFFHLTFDDGLANFYEEVSPILIKKNISASVFLNTDFVDNRDLFFRYKASLLLDNYKRSDKLSKKVYLQFVKEKTMKDLTVSDFLLGINYHNKYLLDELAQKINYSFEDFLNREKPYLSSSQILYLKDQGFTFGAHSLDHPLFADLSLEMQLKQARESIDWVTKNLSTDIKAFSFPFEDKGVSLNFFDQFEYDICFGTYGIKDDIIPYNYQRISFEYSDIDTEKYLIKSLLKYLIKVPLGKHIVRRQ